MRPDFFGDSYDIVKREIIRGLAPPEHWVVHPMYFVEEPEVEFLNQYEEFLGISLVEGWNNARSEVCAVGQRFQKHIFLDPDTGFWVSIPRVRHRGHQANWSEHLCVEELVEIATVDGRKHSLTLVYDQSYSRNRTFVQRRERAAEKLEQIHELSENDVYGVAYVSHSVLIWVSADKDGLIEATQRFLAHSQLPNPLPNPRLIGGPGLPLHVVPVAQAQGI